MGRSHIVHITPVPAGISREAAVARLHDHVAMMQLNPLIIRHELCDAPPAATKDEAELATWYSITDVINYLPGGIAKGEVSYKACFYNLSDGIQTHVFAPAGVDIKSRWSIGGNEPGEPREPSELGVDKPKEGLYIKEEIELKCNMLMGAFVKRNLQNSHREVHEKIISMAAELQAKLKSALGIEPHAAERAQSDDNLVRRAYYGHPSAPADSHRSNRSREIDFSCTCRGTTHLPSCSFFHPGDLQHHGPQLPSSIPYYAISLPASASPYSASVVPATAPLERSLSELHGSPASGKCMCTGGLHDEGCSFYPGLRIPQATSAPLLSNPLSASIHPESVPPRPVANVDVPRLNAPQRRSQPGLITQPTGEQAELPAARSPVESSPSNFSRPFSTHGLEHRSSDKMPA
ncbi:hypothetical protein CKM354_000597100 [Cercospora kikuchii]|uniref:DUF7053 domain-containing protein n=1 Tax=Cercospora kikuchii TaxID=84275 RepID=A0A9P3CJV3_9PEZI|nr:uncharacterized protein CKM354_000597100 [Cercospora kikuchii]GIZ42712.1 hypothetical protein CKM354_000597100 [Cercospora kikuchii]